MSTVSIIRMTTTLGGCATTTPYAPQRLTPPDELSGVQSKTINDVTVSVAILTNSQARRHFGADLGKEGLQALWLRVGNGSPGRQIVVYPEFPRSRFLLGG